MSRKSLMELFSYLCSGILGLGLALYVSSLWIASSGAENQMYIAQNEVPPPPDDLPPPPPDDLPPPPEEVMGGVSSSNEELNTVTESSDANETGEKKFTQYDDFSILEPFIYTDDKNRRDPFKAVNTDSQLFIESGVVQGPMLPLQGFSLSELLLVGILWDVKAPKALFKDPSGKTHIVGKDERIGRNNGYVAVIRESEVIIIEAVRVKGELSYIPVTKLIESAVSN